MTRDGSNDPAGAGAPAPTGGGVRFVSTPVIDQPSQSSAVGGGAGTARQQRSAARPSLSNVVKKDRVGRLSVHSMNFAVPSNDGAQAHAHEHHGSDSWRYRLLKVLHSHPVQIGIFVILILDVLILFVELSLLAAYPSCQIVVRDAINCCPVIPSVDGTEQFLEGTNNEGVQHADGAVNEGHRRHFERFLSESGGHEAEICAHGGGFLEASPQNEAGCDPHKWSSVHAAETALFGVTMAILGLMFMELNLSMVALKPTIFFRQFFYAIDYFVVAVSLVLEATFKSLGDDYLQSLTGALIFFRIWRFVRIAHGIVTVTAEISHQQYESLLTYTEGKWLNGNRFVLVIQRNAPARSVACSVTLREYRRESDFGLSHLPFPFRRTRTAADQK